MNNTTSRLTHVRTFEDPLNVLPWALSKLYTFWLRLTYPFTFMGRGVAVHYSFRASRGMAPRLRLGNSLCAGKDVWLNIIPEASDEVNIIIDDNCQLGPRTCISAKNQIHLQKDVHLGASVLIQDHGHVYEDPNLPISKQPAMDGGRIRIEQGCRIGQGVAIVCSRGELVLGQNCVVMPNSVVIRSAPAHCVLSGNPAKVVERIESRQSNENSVSPSNHQVVFNAVALDRLYPTALETKQRGRTE